MIEKEPKSKEKLALEKIKECLDKHQFANWTVREIREIIEEYERSINEPRG